MGQAEFEEMMVEPIKMGVTDPLMCVNKSE